MYRPEYPKAPVTTWRGGSDMDGSFVRAFGCGSDSHLTRL